MVGLNINDLRFIRRGAASSIMIKIYGEAIDETSPIDFSTARFTIKQGDYALQIKGTDVSFGTGEPDGSVSTSFVGVEITPEQTLAFDSSDSAPQTYAMAKWNESGYPVNSQIIPVEVLRTLDEATI